MALIKFSEFNDDIKDNKIKKVSDKINEEVFEEQVDMTEESTEEKVEEKVEESTEEKVDEDLLIKDEKDVSIEILEEKIVKFNNLKLDDILEKIKNNYSDIDYYIRKKDNELHIVKYNECLDMNVNQFVDGLLKYYTTKSELKKMVEGVSIKGNVNFSIIQNMKYKDRFINDVTKILAKKKI
jgi:hypothetical protein